MSITDELRKYTEEQIKWLDMTKVHYSKLLAIADRIDAEHDEAIQQALMGEGGVPATDENMAEHGWIRLPKDADGEYIHIGDVMEVINSKQRAKACYMQMGPSGTWAVGLTKNCHWYDTESLRHYHAPTVEDVLMEFMDVMLGTPSKDAAARIAEYAAKLQLKEDE